MITDLHFSDYNPAWPMRFADLERDLKGQVPCATVEHVGSTAVPGLAAKDCIDLFVLVPPSELAAAQSALRALGYEERPGSFADDPGRWFWRLIVNDRRHAHAHLMLEGHPAAREMIAVRDLLRRDPAWRHDYQRLKADLAAADAHDRPAYVEGKSAFVRKLTAAAMAQG